MISGHVQVVKRIVLGGSLKRAIACPSTLNITDAQQISRRLRAHLFWVAAFNVLVLNLISDKLAWLWQNIVEGLQLVLGVQRVRVVLRARTAETVDAGLTAFNVLVREVAFWLV